MGSNEEVVEMTEVKVYNQDEKSISLVSDSTAEMNLSDTDSVTTTKTRTVRLVYCGDGVVEECEEDEEEKLRLEEEEKQRQIELRKQMDLEAKKLPWAPWMLYMTKKTARVSLEACDFMGEKLAWWFGITKPKFLYEIEEYNRMKQEQKELEEEDRADEIVLGVESISLKTDNVIKSEEEKLFEYENNNNKQVNLNMENKAYLSDQLFQNH